MQMAGFPGQRTGPIPRWRGMFLARIDHMRIVLANSKERK
jgi:hypothetical protein